jgi:ferredoxin
MSRAALYFSGTGNTEYAARRFARFLGTAEENILSIEDSGVMIEKALAGADTVVIAYPNLLCCIPKILSDYVLGHIEWFENKNIIALVTYAMFSFDCDLTLFRLLRKRRAQFTAVGGVTVQMPLNVCDMKLMKPLPDEEIRRLREAADKKLEERAQAVLEGEVIFDGREWMRPVAFLRQRMFYQSRIKKYYARVRVNINCVGCGECARRCPMRNFEIRDGRAEQKGRCAQCYRCANLCPQNAITIWGREIQWRYGGIQSL